MARTAVQRRPDGSYRIVHVGRLRLALIAIGSLFVFLPLAISLVVVLPPLVLALPPFALGMGVYLVLRSLDHQPPARESTPVRRGPARTGEARVIRLDFSRRVRHER